MTKCQILESFSFKFHLIIFKFRPQSSIFSLPLICQILIGKLSKKHGASFVLNSLPSSEECTNFTLFTLLDFLSWVLLSWLLLLLSLLVLLLVMLVMMLMMMLSVLLVVMLFLVMLFLLLFLMEAGFFGCLWSGGGRSRLLWLLWLLRLLLLLWLLLLLRLLGLFPLSWCSLRCSLWLLLLRLWLLFWLFTLLWRLRWLLLGLFLIFLFDFVAPKLTGIISNEVTAVIVVAAAPGLTITLHLVSIFKILARFNLPSLLEFMECLLLVILGVDDVSVVGHGVWIRILRKRRSVLLLRLGNWASRGSADGIRPVAVPMGISVAVSVAVFKLHHSFEASWAHSELGWSTCLGLQDIVVD